MHTHPFSNKNYAQNHLNTCLSWRNLYRPAKRAFFCILTWFFFAHMGWGEVGWGNKSARVPNVLPRYSDTSYYATAHSLALAQTRLTTLLLVLLCLHRHVTDYVIARFLALAQTRHTMLLHVPLLLRRWNHSKGTWCLQSRVGQKGTVSVHTGGIDTWWKLMKDSIPNNLVNTSGTKVNKKIMENLSLCPLLSMAMGKPTRLAESHSQISQRD